VLRQGPIPRFVHGLIEYVGGGLLVASPFVLDYNSGSATAVAIVLGVLAIVLAATTEGPTSLINSVQLQLHVLLDYALAVILIASPFVFGFSGEGAPTAFFIVIGVLHLLITIGTRFRPRKEVEQRR
jgi:hypothetical protein